jgi:hypothetical protein
LAGISSWALPSGGFAARTNFVARTSDAGAVQNDRQKAIDTGLGIAADVCIRPYPTFAVEIQTQIAGIESAGAKTAYAIVNGIVIGATLTTTTNTVTANTVVYVVSKIC